MKNKLIPLMLILALGACTTANGSSTAVNTQTNTSCCQECLKEKCSHCNECRCKCVHHSADKKICPVK